MGRQTPPQPSDPPSDSSAHLVAAAPPHAGGPPLSSSDIAPALEPRLSPLEIPSNSLADEALRQAIWKQIKQMALADHLGENDVGGADLTKYEPDDIDSMDNSRLARLVYGLSYVRLLELLSRPTRNFSQTMEVGKLGMAFIRHVETNDRDVLKLDARSTYDRNLDEAIATVSADVMRIAATYKVKTQAK